MAVKKTAAEQPAETTVNAGLALRRLGVSIYVGPSILGYIQKNTIYPCAAAEAVNRDRCENRHREISRRGRLHHRHGRAAHHA